VLGLYIERTRGCTRKFTLSVATHRSCAVERFCSYRSFSLSSDRPNVQRQPIKTDHASFLSQRMAKADTLTLSLLPKILSPKRWSIHIMRRRKILQEFFPRGVVRVRRDVRCIFIFARLSHSESRFDVEPSVFFQQ